MQDNPGSRYKYVFVRGDCPEWARCGGEGPIILMSCPHCKAIIAACSETDDIMGVYSEPGSHDLTPRTDQSEWHSCPSCGGEISGPCYAAEEELIAFGIPSAGLVKYQSHSESPHVDCNW